MQEPVKYPRLASFVSLNWYDGFISFLFRFVAKTSEPLLAIGVIVSAADFLQKGQLMSHNPTLSSAWAWTQALAIEASTGPVLVFALQAFRAGDKVKGVLYAVLAALLFIVGGAMLLLQLISNAGGLSEASINHDLLYTLFVLRVIVASGMVALSCTKHMRFSGESSVLQEQQTPALDVKEIVNELDLRMKQHLEQRIEAVFERVQITIEQAVGNTGEFAAIQAPARKDENLLANDMQVSDKDSNQPILIERFQSKKETIADILQRLPGASAEQVASEAGCDVRTASKWMQRLQE